MTDQTKALLYFPRDTCSRIMTGDVCGNGEIGGFEQCDDGNTVFYPPDGCGQYCFFQEGFSCTTVGPNPTDRIQDDLNMCGNGMREEGYFFNE